MQDTGWEMPGEQGYFLRQYGNSAIRHYGYNLVPDVMDGLDRIPFNCVSPSRTKVSESGHKPARTLHSHGSSPVPRLPRRHSSRISAKVC
jgi:hypothetical protein